MRRDDSVLRERFEPRGRAMKEWAVLACEPDAAIELAREAMAFVRGR